MNAEHLLRCALTYRDAASRTRPLTSTFESPTDAVAEWMRVLMHEAGEAMREPLAEAPEHPYLHPVDVDTDDPGIHDKRDDPTHVLRCTLPAPRVTYTARPDAVVRPPPETTTPVERSAEEARAHAGTELSKSLQRSQNQAAGAEKRAATQQQRRAEETPEARAERLELARQKRAERKAREQSEESPPTKKKEPPPPPTEDALLVPDATLRPRRKAGKKRNFFEHPLPHDRHLGALQRCAPHPLLLPALLRGEICERLEIVQGPPGTGKTRALVRRACGDFDGRVLLCAPTNVGAAALYARCLSEGWGAEAALCLPPERLPVGTVVESNDPTRRIVCATVSGRGGPALDAQRFALVGVDEAAQCMEAWTWTLLRPEVEWLVLAGDVRQLPALVSESGRALKHERSLMERLVSDLQYDNVVELTEQNRMAPEILAVPNAAFYGGRLTSGPHAPPLGSVEWVVLPEGVAEASGTSWCNRAEAQAVVDAVVEGEDTVLLAPYTAQCRLLLAQKTGCEVHTVDSFQGREADTVVLSVVRDGRSGNMGFWADLRRLTVALTRARRRLVVVASNVAGWPPDLKNSFAPPTLS